MSASEKLKALDELYADAERNDPDFKHSVLYDALPQLLAVVEAAEVLPDFFDTPDYRRHSFIPLLDLLDEALS